MLQRPPYPSDICDDDQSKPVWVEVLQFALDGLIPSDERLEDFLDRYERMP